MGQFLPLMATVATAGTSFRMVRFLRLTAMGAMAGTSFRMVRFLPLMVTAATAEILGWRKSLLNAKAYSGFPAILSEVGVWP
jgi:hypothetical protein